MNVSVRRDSLIVLYLEDDIRTNWTGIISLPEVVEPHRNGNNIIHQLQRCWVKVWYLKVMLNL